MALFGFARAVISFNVCDVRLLPVLSFTNVSSSSSLNSVIQIFCHTDFGWGRLVLVCPIHFLFGYSYHVLYCGPWRWLHTLVRVFRFGSLEEKRKFPRSAALSCHGVHYYYATLFEDEVDYDSSDECGRFS